MIAPRKRTENEIHETYLTIGRRLSEPPFSATQAELHARAIEEFNRGAYYDAHESWEHCWRAMRNSPEDDAEIILRGLVQLAAGYHCLSQQRMKDALGNFKKAAPKLRLVQGIFLGINFDRIAAHLPSLSTREMNETEAYPIISLTTLSATSS